MWFLSTLLSTVLHCGKRIWKSRIGDSDVDGGGRDKTEVVHRGQTSHRTGKLESFPLEGSLICNVKSLDTSLNSSYLLVLSLLLVQGNTWDFLHLLFKSANNHEVPAMWPAQWSV